MATRPKLSVSQLNDYVAAVLQRDPLLVSVEVTGEISNLKMHQTGMMFFTLKDARAAVSCIMFAGDVERLAISLSEGLKVTAIGSVGLYAKGGQYRLTVRELHSAGMGVLYEQLQKRKAKMLAEGVFDSNRKKALPSTVHTLGVVSSPTGAVIHDIMSVSLRRDPGVRILLCPVRVQGVGADLEVAQAIRRLDAMPEVSVIIIARGGGSLEDLWTFNEESVVYAVAEARKPIISAIGHETDYTLCDLAADMRAPTPSAAAELAVPCRDELLEEIFSLREGLRDSALRRLEMEKQKLQVLRLRLAAEQPQKRVQEQLKSVLHLRAALQEAMARRMTAEENRLARQREALNMLSPYQVLGRGYTLVKDASGNLLREAGSISPRQPFVVIFADGQVNAIAEQIEMKE